SWRCARPGLRCRSRARRTARALAGVSPLFRRSPLKGRKRCGCRARPRTQWRCRRAPLARFLRRAGQGARRERQRLMSARAELNPSVVDRIKATLVGLRMPRALEIVDAIVRQLERGEVSALEAIDAMLAEEFTLRESRRIKTSLVM